MPPQSSCHQLLDKIIYHCKHWHANQNSGKTKHTAKQCDRKQNPEAAQPYATCQQPRSQDISIKLLQNNNENKKDHTIHGACDQNQQCRRNCSDKRAEIRNNICHAYDHTNQYCIWKICHKAHNQTKCITNQAYHSTVQNLSCKKNRQTFYQ